MPAALQSQLCFSPLEQFVRDYVEARAGAWDEIEPQVYDLLIGSEMTQIAFDPEALPEHPQARLASLGSPLIDEMLADAGGRWPTTRCHRVGLNLNPRDLESRLRRAVALPLDCALRIGRTRALDFPQAVFWFEAMFSGDQKEHELLPMGIDLHHLRSVRHLEVLLAPGRLAAEPEFRLAEARHAGLKAGYRAARNSVAGTIIALANVRRREWSGRVETQISRMTSYYAQLRREAEQSAARGNTRAAAIPGEAVGRAAARREAIDREEKLRIAELQRKSQIRVDARLVSLMVIRQPKLLLTATVSQKDRSAGTCEAVWDPLADAVEAVACPGCGQPTFSLLVGRTGLGCPHCPSAARAKP